MTKPIENLPLARLMRDYQQRVNQCLDHWLPPLTTSPVRLHKAMRYAVLDGGKRVRPFLVYATGQALGTAPESLDGPACAVELIHAYSLIHDDLPAMDDDDLRRGKPTCHRAFDEATAILAGDALQSLAFHILASDVAMTTGPEQRVDIISTLALAIGSRGMVGGQVMDLDAEGRSLDIAELEDMHIHKTGALIRASVRLGALGSADRSPATLKQLDHYAKCIGLAFQIRDDILDVEGDTRVMGKTRGSDHAQGKTTYPSVMGLASARQMASELLDSALDSLSGLSETADALRWIATFIVERSR